MKRSGFKKPTLFRAKIILTWVLCFWLFQDVVAQTLALTDMSMFNNPGKSWKIVGQVTADINKPNVMIVSQGSGILVNSSDKNKRGSDLFTKDEYGDLELELDYMMAKGSNSGIYLQGNYELQLEDTWGIKNPTSGHNGGIYERWEEARPEGQRGFEGHAPRQNASRAPGLWQHLKLSFQAPRFDVNGIKTEPAKMLRVELNGVLIHENVVMSGPTRGGMGAEKAKGPLRIQGDHGSVALRNIKIISIGQPRIMEVEPPRPNQVYPILVDASTIPVLRSFMDLPGGVRVVHAVSVGSNEQIHYTYDMDTGMIIQVWRGGFLDATPMWNSRGDGSTRPLGTVLRFGNPVPMIAKSPSSESAWASDTTGSRFRPKGYRLDNAEKPIFQYQTFGMKVMDTVKPLPNGQGIVREITIENPIQQLYFHLAEGTSIVETEKGIYTIGDQSYYLRLDDVGNAKPIIRDSNGKKALIVPISRTLKYSILF